MQCRRESDRSFGDVRLETREETEASKSTVATDEINPLPCPVEVPFPWSVSLSGSASNSQARDIIGEEAINITGNEPLRERRRWIRPHVLEPLSYQHTSTHSCKCAEGIKNKPEQGERVPLSHNSDNTPSDVFGFIRPETQKLVLPHHDKAPFQHESIPFPGRSEGNSPPMENLLDKSLPYDDHLPGGNLIDSPVAARVPSPSSASSVTSGRRLEWDSLADVGYQNFHHDDIYLGVGLSTIERMVLARGYPSDLCMRSDPEGTTGSMKKLHSIQDSLISFKSPLAKSTPVSQGDGENKAMSSINKNDVPLVLSDGYFYVHSSEECDNEGTPPREEKERESSSQCSNPLKKFHSTSLTDLKTLEGGNSSHSLPRSQSHLNVVPRENEPNLSGGKNSSTRSVNHLRTLAAACSASSSSVATIVQKSTLPRPTTNKLIQTMPMKVSIGIQTGENVKSSNILKSFSKFHHEEESASRSESDEKSNCVQSEKEAHSCKGAHKKGSSSKTTCSYSTKSLSVSSGKSQNIATMSAEVVNDNKECLPMEKPLASDRSGTLESATSSTNTAASSGAAETSCSGTGRPVESRRESAGVVDSAHSFEYLPGHVFESKDSASVKSSEHDKSENSRSASRTFGKMCNSSSSSSLAKDIEEGVELLKGLVAGKTFNGKSKKTLIRQIINKLVDTDYNDDSGGSQQVGRHIPLSSNVPWVPAAPSSKPLQADHLQPKISLGEWSGTNQTPSEQPLTRRSACSSKGLDENQIGAAPSGVGSTESSCTPSGSVSVPGDNEESQVDSTGISSRTSSARPPVDWKMATTRTEREFEKNRSQSSLNSYSSSLMKFCKTEREKQLHWISFEIDHLNNLRKLLEKQEGLTKSLSSHLISHQHKYHRPRNCKTAPSQRFEDAAAAADESSRSVHSACAQCQPRGPSPTNSLRTQPSSSSGTQDWSARYRARLRQTQTQGISADRKETQDVSMQTLTLDSYILSGADAVKNSLHSKSGQINVYSQTSPRAFSRLEQVHQDSQTTPRVEGATAGSYHVTSKCCCECRKAFEEILKKGVGKQKAGEQFEKISATCRSHTENSTQSSRTIGSSEVSNIGSSTFSSASQNASKICKGKSEGTRGESGRKTNIATETIVNKSIQTSESLKDVPLIRPVWYMTEIHTGEKSDERKNESIQNGKERSDVCPCCGLFVSQASVNKKSSRTVQEFYEKGSESQTSRPVASSQDIGSTLHNVSSQTELQKTPLAYLLTFEPTSKENIRLRRRKSLPEIKIFVPQSSPSAESTVSGKGDECTKENSRPVTRQRKSPCRLVEVEVVKSNEKEQQKQSLQEYLKVNRPQYLEHADHRTRCLADLAMLREMRRQKRLELLTMTDNADSAGSSRESPRPSKRSTSVPKKPGSTLNMMKQQTRKNYKTKEVQMKLAEKKKKEDFRTNRLMAELFTRKLQRKVLQGVVNHSNSASVISSTP